MTSPAIVREALEGVPIPGKMEPASEFYARMDVWLKGPYHAALAALDATPEPSSDAAELVEMFHAAERNEGVHQYPAAELPRLLRDQVCSVLICEAEPHVVADAIGIVIQSANALDATPGEGETGWLIEEDAGGFYHWIAAMQDARHRLNAERLSSPTEMREVIAAALWADGQMRFASCSFTELPRTRTDFRHRADLVMTHPAMLAALPLSDG